MRFADSFRAARWVRLVNLLLQAVLFLTLFAGLNYIALNHAWRFDLTKSRRHSLSPETRSYLDGLQTPIRILVTLTDDRDVPGLSESYRDISGLLREYVYATHKNERGKITVKFLDVYQDRKEAEELGIDQPNLVILVAGDKSTYLNLSDFYHTRRKGQEVSREAFIGESALTAAILDVAAPEKKRIYFLQGHGEIQPDSTHEVRGFSQLTAYLRARNFDLAGLDLSSTRRVPDDAALLIIAGPQSRYDPVEQEILRNYLQTRAGRMILMLDPKWPHGLDNLLFDWGVTVYDNQIFESNPEEQNELGDLRLRSFRSDHPITQSLVSNNLPVLIGPARVVSDDLGRSTDDGLNVVKLMATSKARTAWGESNYRMRMNHSYTPGEDLLGELGVLVVSERVKPALQLPLSVPGGRLAVFGTSDLVTNNRIANLGNLSVFLNTVNWTAETKADLTIPPRPVESFQLTLSQDQVGRLRLVMLLAVPGVVALLGLFVYWTRRA